ncbi:MAG: hypothetical protein ACRYFX_23910 [Janthinobacterium lividum]
MAKDQDNQRGTSGHPAEAGRQSPKNQDDSSPHGDTSAPPAEATHKGSKASRTNQGSDYGGYRWNSE